MAYIQYGYSPPPGDYNGYGYAGFSFKKLGKAIGGAVKAVAKPISSVGRAIDPTYSKGLIGRITYPIARPMVATAAAAMTGGLSVLAGEKGWISKSTFGIKPTVTGIAIGAAVGGAILTGGGILAAIGAGAGKVAQSTAGSAAPATSVPVVTDVPAAGIDPATGQPKSGGGLAGAAAGAGAGFLFGGPPGAIIGAGAGYFLTKPKA